MNTRLQGRLRCHRLNLSQWRVLSVLNSFGQLSVTQIVEHTLMEQPTVSRVISQLEHDTLVLRTLSPEDSRISFIILSPKGDALFQEIAPAAMRHQKVALEGLSEPELASLRRLLGLIERNITQDR